MVLLLSVHCCMHSYHCVSEAGLPKLKWSEICYAPLHSSKLSFTERRGPNLLVYTMEKTGVKEEVVNGVGELLLTWLYSDLVPGSVHEAI